MEWLQNNIGTVAVAAVVLIVLGAIAYKLIRDKKQGKTTCSCGCSGCGLKDKCGK